MSEIYIQTSNMNKTQISIQLVLCVAQIKQSEIRQIKLRVTAL